MGAAAGAGAGAEATSDKRIIGHSRPSGHRETEMCAQIQVRVLKDTLALGTKTLFQAGHQAMTGMFITTTPLPRFRSLSGLL
jgi:hypothetical protein